MNNKKKEVLQPTTYLKKSVVKSNDLNEAISHLNVMEYRLLLILISQIQSTINEEDATSLHMFTTKHVAQLLGITNNKDFYNRIKTAVKYLHKKTVHISHGDVEIEHTWLITSYYSNKNGNFALELNPNLKPYVLNLTGAFTKYTLTVALSLPTMSAIRLYELLKQYARIGSRSFDINTLRLMLGLKASDYPVTSDFKKRVLNPAVKHINKNTELKIAFTPIKDSRNIVGYKFTIKEDKAMGLEPIQQPKSLPVSLVKELTDLGFTAKEINFLHNYRPSFLREHLDYMLQTHKDKDVTEFKKAFKYRIRKFARESIKTKKEVPVTAELLQQSIAESKEREQVAITEHSEEPSMELTTKDQFAVEQLNNMSPDTTFLTTTNENRVTPLPVIEPIEQIKPISARDLEEFEQRTVKSKGIGLLSRDMYMQLTALGLTKAQIKHVSLNYSEDYLRNSLEYTQARHLKKPLDSPKSYFLRAVKENYYEQSLSVREGARGVLRGDVTSHLPKVPSPVQPSSDWVMVDELPIIPSNLFKGEFNEKDINDVCNYDYIVMTSDAEFLSEYRVHLGFVESKVDLQNLKDEYVNILHNAIQNGLDIEVARKLEPELVDYYIEQRH